MQFKIKMTADAVLAGYPRSHRFFKGRTYRAENATNLPNWKRDGKVYVYKIVRLGEGFFPFNHSLMLVKGDYVKV